MSTTATVGDVARPGTGRATSLPGLLLERAAAAPDRVALRRSEECIWAEITWKGYASAVARIGRGLRALGVEAGEHVAIHADNRPEWLYCDLGTQSIGAVTVGVYPTSPPAEVRYVLEHAGAVVLVAEDEEQLDKVLEVREHLPLLRHIVVIDTSMVVSHLDDPQILSYADLEAMGEGADDADHERLVAGLDPSATATIVYTSGTTGPPKGAMLTHGNLLAAAEAYGALGELRATDELLSYLPLCHIAERLNSVVHPLWSGAVVNFGHGGDTFASDLREVQPTAFLGVPRVWEKMMAGVETGMADATWLKRTTYSYWMRQGARTARRRMEGRSGPLDRATSLIGSLLLYRSLRDKLGLRRIRLAVSGAAPISPAVLEFFWALGVPIREAYGQTENTAVATYTPRDRVRIGSVGVALPGTEIRLADDGEILTRSAATFAGYHRDPAATATVLDDDGWLHTGDIGTLDDGGHLTITDRKKDILITAGGKNIAPSVIENQLKVSPFVREAIVVGDGRKYLTALIGIEADTVGDWASRRYLPFTTYGDLVDKPEVRALVEEWVAHVNRELAQVEQIKDFRLLPRLLDHEEGQLTATQKVKRRAVSDQFATLIEEMYR